MVVDLLQGGKCIVWHLWEFWEEVLKELEGLTFVVLHQFHEGNQAAYFLARQGENGHNFCYEGSQDLPWLLKGIIWLDKLGLPHLRS